MPRDSKNPFPRQILLGEESCLADALPLRVSEDDGSPLWRSFSDYFQTSYLHRDGLRG
jgi:hypothetical protein